MPTIAKGLESARHPQYPALPAFNDLLVRVAGECREMPGLSLTVSQAERLWGLDRGTCAIVMTALIERQILRRTPTGTYLRRVG